MALRDRLFAEKVHTKDVPDYGQFHLRIISGQERQHYINTVRKANEQSDELDMYASLLVAAIAQDEHGQREFKDDEQEKVRGLPSPLIKALFDHAHAINFPTTDEIKKN